MKRWNILKKGMSIGLPILVIVLVPGMALIAGAERCMWKMT